MCFVAFLNGDLDALGIKSDTHALPTANRDLH